MLADHSLKLAVMRLQQRIRDPVGLDLLIPKVPMIHGRSTKWWILGGLGLAMAAGAGFMLKNNNGQPAAGSGAIASAPIAGPGALLATLKEELFAVETDRLEGRLTDAEYTEQKAALEVVLKRALSRRSDGVAATKAAEVESIRG